VVIATQFHLALMQIYIPQASAWIFLLRVHNSDSHKIAQNLSLLEKIFSFSQLHPVIFVVTLRRYQFLKLYIIGFCEYQWMMNWKRFERNWSYPNSGIIPEFAKRNRDKQKETWDCILLSEVKCKLEATAVNVNFEWKSDAVWWNGNVWKRACCRWFRIDSSFQN